MYHYLRMSVVMCVGEIGKKCRKGTTWRCVPVASEEVGCHEIGTRHSMKYAANPIKCLQRCFASNSQKAEFKEMQ